MTPETLAIIALSAVAYFAGAYLFCRWEVRRFARTYRDLQFEDLESGVIIVFSLIWPIAWILDRPNSSLTILPFARWFEEYKDNG